MESDYRRPQDASQLQCEQFRVTINSPIRCPNGKSRLKKQGFAPATIVTDKLRSYGTAIRLLALSAQHEQGLRKNNRAENSHQPVRRRERKMQRFKSPASAQRFLAVHATVYNLFNVQRHLVSRRTLRQFRGDAMRQWRQVTTVA